MCRIVCHLSLHEHLPVSDSSVPDDRRTVGVFKLSDIANRPVDKPEKVVITQIDKRLSDGLIAS